MIPNDDDTQSDEDDDESSKFELIKSSIEQKLGISSDYYDEDLCLNVLLKNFESIQTLEIVPEELKDRLCEMYCDTRGIDIRFLHLLVGKNPEIVRVKNCSWMTEEEMTECFGECELNRLRVLQLDLCARCLSDNILHTTLAHSPGCMPALVTISLKGGYRISDVGLSLLVAAAPFLRSINLSECSLLTFMGINITADSLGLILRELYLDYCEAVDLDVMRILPAMRKLLCLEVLSLRGLQTVCDDFVTGVVVESGTNMKELVLASCLKLTDRSIKAMAKICSGLYALDISDLPQLTDLSICYIANGCSMIQNLELRRNAFSDEAIAALLEIRGESLKVLSLCKNVGPNTAISLARCCTRNLLILDLSFCRKLTEEALGYIIDSCLSLRLLKVFGCAQITRVLVDGHSNPLVNIIGLQLAPILENLNAQYTPEPEEREIDDSEIEEILRSNDRFKKERVDAENIRFENMLKFHSQQYDNFWCLVAETQKKLSREEDPEHLPGPFSAAMKIVKDENKKQNVGIQWVPSNTRIQNRVRKPPSLEDLCLNVLLENIESVRTLENVPGELKDKLSQLYCDSRVMDIHFMSLLVGKNPDIVRVKDCSWMEEEDMNRCFGECELNKLSVLQLDSCQGRSQDHF